MIVFANSNSFSFLRLNLSTSNFCAFLFTYQQPFPNICTYQTVISTTVSSLEGWYIEDPRRPYPICQYVIILVVSLPIRRSPCVFMNVSVREHLALNRQILWCGKIYYSGIMILVHSPYRFVNIPSPQFALKSPTRNSILYTGKWLKICFNSA